MSVSKVKEEMPTIKENKDQLKKKSGIKITSIFSFNTLKKEPKRILNLPAPIDSFDIESTKGRFGWYTLGGHFLAYLMRRGEKYCAVRMMESCILTLMSNINHRIYYDCTNITSYRVTESERSLLTEINSFHCDYQFGPASFSRCDLLIRMDDAAEFYKFLVICYNKLFKINMGTKCGFIQINKTSLIPYVCVNKKQYVPLFYFDVVEPSTLKTTMILKDWPLSYLKFCYRVQAIRDEFVKQEECTVACFEELKGLFEAKTEFEEFWPTDISNQNLTNTGGSYQTPPLTAWYRQPTNVSAPQILYT